ncbi:MAG TPA: fibronectin type III domain-containing protein, partial [Elusimicrobiales bacterium]|nr:fibronectin type III domain-containing protein [Elusimicrobiales bacterium]
MTAFMTRKAGSFAARLAAACFLFAAAGNAGAQGLSPVNTGAAVDSLSFSWGGAGPFVIALSTAADFSVLSATGTLNASPTTYVNLSQDERYYFRVKRSDDPDTAYADNQLSTVTLAAAPSGIYFESTNFASESAAAAQVGIGWNVNGNPEWTSYLVSYSKDPGMAGASAFQEPYPPVSLGGLEANTTYYFSLRARNMADVYTSSTPVSSTATLALSLPSINTAVYQTSATVSWTPLSGAVQSQRAEGYGFALSIFPTLVPQLSVWSTADNAVSSVTLSGLDRNSAYYYRVGSLNISGAMNSDYVRSFTTLTSTTGLTLLDRSTQTARLAWTALPQSPSSATAAGYLLEASSTGFSGGTVLSTATGDITLSTLGVSGILANTTYYFRVGTLNLEGVPNYSGRLSTITLSVPLSAGLLSTDLSSSSIRVRINAPLPASPAESSCEGYLLQASSVNFTGGSVVYSSFSHMSTPASLTIGGLRSNTLYRLRIATLNWDGTPNHTALPDATTLVAAPLTSVSMNGIWESSAAVSFSRIDSDGYVLEASTRPAFIPVFASSATMDPAATGLTVSGLDENTVYYFRAGALYNGATVYTDASPGNMSTLALRLGSPAKSGVFHSSISVSWTPLAVVSQDTNAESYRLEASTSPGFETVSFSSETFNTSLGGLCLEGLAPNTSYYLRAATLNWDGVGNYSYIAGTSTLADAPAQQQFTSLSTGSMTVN